MPIDPRDNSAAHVPHDAAALLAAAILRLHQHAALAEKESPKSPELTLAAAPKTVLTVPTG